MITAYQRAAATSSTLALCLALATPALGQSRQVTTPNTTTGTDPVSVTLNGTVFVNKGIVGVGRLDANTRDFAGETLGSFSGMALDLNSWRRNGDGSYVGNMFTLPDRGPNDVGPFVGTTNYRNRVHTSQLTLRPYTGTAALPQSTASQSQLTIAPTGGFFLTDSTGTNFTGKDPVNSTITRGGVIYPFVATGEGAGGVSLDGEAIAVRPDGSFYVSDEYAANIYYFSATGRQLGALNTVPALTSQIAGAISFNSAVAPTQGRRNNQGLEALAITPDNRRLVTILQSATVQDTNGANQQTRNNTRILVYDIAGNAVPASNPIGHYVLQLPTFTVAGDGGAVNRTAAQSEMLALNDRQFLVLSRDGQGRGAGGSPIDFKSVLLVDTTGATNLAGTQYETGYTPIATNGNLVAGIVPVQQVELVNMLNITQLNRFGMNLDAAPSLANSLSEKWEAMGLAPVLEENAPHDFFLFIGNDNDFQAANGFINGQSYNASLSGPGGTGNNDSVMIVYRLTLPTYVDPKALESRNASAPAMLRDTRAALTGLGLSATQPAMQFVHSQRGGAALPGAPRFRLWAEGGWNRLPTGETAPGALKLNVAAFTMGLDLALGDSARVGAFGGYRNLDGRMSSGLPLDAKAWTAGAYGALAIPGGLRAQAALAWLGNAKFGSLARNAAYGQQATGSTKGDGWSASAELGWNTQALALRYGPFAAVDYTSMKLAGWSESGASLSNLVFPDREFRKLTASLGIEAGLDLGKLHPSLRAGYSFERESGDETATVSLKSAQHVMGRAAFPVGETARDAAFAEARLVMQSGSISGYVAGRGRWGRGTDDVRLAVGLAYGF